MAININDIHNVENDLKRIVEEMEKIKWII
jgi:hypothetical protein